MANILCRMLNSLAMIARRLCNQRAIPPNSSRAALFREQGTLKRRNFRHFVRIQEPIEAMGVLVSWIRATG
jgi:hypothetical protein